MADIKRRMSDDERTSTAQRLHEQLNDVVAGLVAEHKGVETADIMDCIGRATALMLCGLAHDNLTSPIVSAEDFVQAHISDTVTANPEFGRPRRASIHTAGNA